MYSNSESSTRFFFNHDFIINQKLQLWGFHSSLKPFSKLLRGAEETYQFIFSKISQAIC